jgi:hypothetical protein
VSDGEPESRIGEPDTDPRPLAVTFVTTEHFVLLGVRAHGSVRIQCQL